MEFSGVEQGIPDTIAQLPSTTSISAGAVAGIVIAIVLVLVLILIAVIAIVFVRKRDRKYIISTAGREDVRYVPAGGTFISPTGVCDERNMIDESDVPMFVKTDTLPVTAFIAENEQAAVDDEDVLTATKMDMNDDTKDTHL